MIKNPETLIEEIGSLMVVKEPHEIRNFLGTNSLEVIARWHMKEVAKARIDSIQYANQILFSLLPTGDVETWDVLKAIRDYQALLSDHIAELSKTLKESE